MANRLTLGNHWEHFIQQEIKSGRYVSVADVLRDALRALEERRNHTHSSHPTLPSNPRSPSAPQTAAPQISTKPFDDYFCVDHIIHE